MNSSPPTPRPAPLPPRFVGQALFAIAFCAVVAVPDRIGTPIAVGPPGRITDTMGVASPTPRPPMDGLWLSRSEILALPTTGPAWAFVQASADAPEGPPTVCDQDSHNNVRVLAKALVHVRTGAEPYRTAVRRNIAGVMGTESGWTCRSLALGRKLAAYVIAADLVGLEAGEDAAFRAWLAGVRHRVMARDRRSLVACQEERPNNWGTMCGASRAAASAYLGDTADLDRTARVLRGYLGDRDAYTGFEFGRDLSWQSDAAAPRGVNPEGATKQGIPVDGAIADDMRRGGAFTTGCPATTGYPWEALQGLVVEAEILHRRGYDAWQWEDQAARRSVRYLRNLDLYCGGWWAAGDDAFTPWIVNHAYGTAFPAVSPVRLGKIMSFTDWTHDRAARPR